MSNEKRIYSSFDEVDRDLEILKLQNEIDKEEAKLHFTLTKQTLTPKYFFKNASMVVKKKALETKAMVKGAANGFIENFKEKNFKPSRTELRVEPIEKEVKPVKGEIVVEKVVVDTETAEINKDRSRPI